MGKVVVFGSINRDLVARVARTPHAGETVASLSYAEYPGGKGANQAIAARRMGARVALVGAVGADGHGVAMRDFLSGEGVDLGSLRVLADHATGLAIIVVDAAGENTIIVVPGANSRVSGEMLVVSALEAGDILLAQCEVPVAEIEVAFRKAKRAGAMTLLNPAPMQPLPPALLALCDVIVMNEGELAALCGRNTPFDASSIEPAMQDFRQSLAPSCILITTLGAAGALALGPKGTIRIPGYAASSLDTTGAGDCFVGVLAAALCEKVSLNIALSRANRAASLSVTRKGAAISMPFRSELA